MEKGKREDAGRAEGGGGQDAGGQVQLLLLDDRGVHLELDSASKRAEAWHFNCAGRLEQM